MLNNFHDFFVVNAYTHNGLTQIRVLSFFFKEFVKVIYGENLLLNILGLLEVGENLLGLQFLRRIALLELIQPNHLLSSYFIVFFVFNLLNDVEISFFAYVGVGYSV